MAHQHSERLRNVGLAAATNIIFTVLEFGIGIATNSLALVADSLHDLGDSIVLAISWIAEKKAGKGPDSVMTYGYARLSLLSSLLAGIVLVAGSLAVLAKAVPRLVNPEHVKAGWVVMFSVFGVLFNGYAYFRLKKGRSQNEKTLSWHLLEDMLGWIVVLIGSLVMAVTDLHIIDPIMTILFTAFILYGVSRNVLETLKLLMDGVPSGIDIGSIMREMRQTEGVVDVHDVHVWSLDGEDNILTAHVVAKDGSVRRRIREALKKFGISHSTIEVEEKKCGGCGLSGKKLEK